ncbi:MAG: hypothetical protein RH917_10395 [Lacipirellulaceae bacterium]
MSLRFGLADLLLGMIVLSYLAAIAARLPSLDLNEVAWGNVVSIGVSAAVWTYLAWVTVVVKTSHRWLVAVACIFFTILSAILLARFDYFVNYFASQTYGWPPVEPNWPSLTAGDFIKLRSLNQQNFAWCVVASCSSILVALWLCGFVYASSQKPRKKAATFTFLSVSLIAMVLPLLATFWRFVDPPDAPEVQLPDPNGYDRLVALATQTQNSTINDSIYGLVVAPTPEREKAVAEVEHQVRQAREAMRLDSVVPIDYQTRVNLFTNTDYFADIQALRSLARCLSEVASVHAVNREWQDALEVNLDLVDLGRKTAKGGLESHHLIGASLNRTAYYQICEIRNRLNAQQRTQVCQRVTAHLLSREPIQQIVKRNRNWKVLTSSWMGKLRIHLQEVFEDADSYYANHLIEVFRTEEMEARMLLAAMAIIDFQEAHNALPKMLEETKPIGGIDSLVDPYDAERGLLRYRRLSDEEFLLYSLGRNGTDENGTYELDDYEGDVKDITLESLFERDRLEAEAFADEVDALDKESAADKLETTEE